MELNWVKVLGEDGQDKLYVCDFRKLRRVDYAEGGSQWVAKVGDPEKEQFFKTEKSALEALGVRSK